MPSVGKVVVDTRRLDQLSREMQELAQHVIDKTAFDTKAGAQERAPVDTGALKNSIEVKTGKLHDDVFVGVEYGIYQELGTRKMRAHPFLVPALEAVRPKFLAAWRELFKRFE